MPPAVLCDVLLLGMMHFLMFLLFRCISAIISTNSEVEQESMPCQSSDSIFAFVYACSGQMVHTCFQYGKLCVNMSNEATDLKHHRWNQVDNDLDADLVVSILFGPNPAEACCHSHSVLGEGS